MEFGQLMEFYIFLQKSRRKKAESLISDFFLLFEALYEKKVSGQDLSFNGVWAIAPDETCPLDNCPPDYCPLDDCPRIISHQIIGSWTIAPKIVDPGQFPQFYKHSETETASKRRISQEQIEYGTVKQICLCFPNR